MPQTPSIGDIQQLLHVMARLRDREHGCPWDVQQTFASIAPYTIEEAYEVADAIDRNDLAGLRDELGDLLLQVVFHSQMAAEQGRLHSPTWSPRFATSSYAATRMCSPRNRRPMRRR